jgi:hypothetical protein
MLFEDVRKICLSQALAFKARLFIARLKSSPGGIILDIGLIMTALDPHFWPSCLRGVSQFGL